jgi:hypothetical protein
MILFLMSRCETFFAIDISLQVGQPKIAFEKNHKTKIMG